MKGIKKMASKTSFQVFIALKMFFFNPTLAFWDDANLAVATMFFLFYANCCLCFRKSQNLRKNGKIHLALQKDTVGIS